MIIGIDLGTTHSVAAHMTAEGPRLIPNALGETLTPSVVGFEPDGKVLIGRAALEYRVTHPERCASLFKRHMGTDWKFTLDGKSYTPEQLSSLVLRALKDDAEALLGQSIEDAVITVPAYFSDPQRKATMRAGHLAGLDVRRIINEPTAAAIAYGLHEADSDKIVVVFDLGGGTFDVSVVELFEGAIEVRSSSGESFLGGEDFTRTLAARVMESQGLLFERTELEAPLLVSRMIQQAELAKRQLTRGETAVMRVPNRAGELQEDSPQVRVTREQFQQWTEHTLARIELPIRRALGDAQLRRTDINEVILVGGATRMPAVAQRVTELFAQAPHSRLNPDEVVALGAAVQAGLIGRDESLEDVVVTDVAPFTLGVEITKQIGAELRPGYFNPVINRNTTIPVSRVDRLSTLRANQTEVRVKVYQGESRKVQDNLLLGEFVVKDIPRGPAGQEIDVRFTYDLNGVLEVEATVVETQKKSSIVITQHARGLTEQQIARAIDEMQTMKTHPREETANRFLLKRAERIYRELPLMDREMLADVMDGFETALDMQDQEVIERFRLELEMFLSRYEADDVE
ncbi:MAG: Hsp70 family protein, partial [Planctomycetales bacterium]|nr:Hsp70 family protein [Planctomycetales bacterium]